MVSGGGDEEIQQSGQKGSVLFSTLEEHEDNEGRQGILRRMRTRVNERSHNNQKKKRTQDKDAG